MTSNSSKKLYCSDCKEITEHINLGYADPQAIIDIMDEYYEKHPEDLRSGLYNKYPSWLKTTTAGASGVIAGFFNAASNYLIQKDYASFWICSECKHPQNRMFE